VVCRACAGHVSETTNVRLSFSDSVNRRLRPCRMPMK
jgi:hypothetical protein